MTYMYLLLYKVLQAGHMGPERKPTVQMSAVDLL